MKRFGHPATVIASLALFVALGSGAALASGLISGTKIVNHSIPEKKLTAAAIKALHGLQGPPGPKGPAGPTGLQGPTGATGLAGTNGATNVVVRTAIVSVPTASGAIQGVPCNPGERATGGGVKLDIVSPLTETVNASYPIFNGGAAAAGQTPNGWASSIMNNTGSTMAATFFAICASP